MNFIPVSSESVSRSKSQKNDGAYCCILADLYYDVESNIYQIDKDNQNANLPALKKSLVTENERIRTELLQMNPAELKMASSVLTKSILLSRDSN